MVLQPDWEQVGLTSVRGLYCFSIPPSVCKPESQTTCGQGDAPLLGILAESVSNIQVTFWYFAEFITSVDPNNVRPE